MSAPFGAAEDAAEVVFRAQEGRQRQFSQCSADIAIYGGAAGGGKSYALLLEASKWAHVGGYRAVLFRRVHTDLMQEGGLWDESGKIYPHLGGNSVQSPRAVWSFPSGARISFDHMSHEKATQRKQGLQAAFFGFDELTHFTAEQFWYVVGRLRSVCGVKPYVRATCNPDPDSFVRRLIDWWIGPDGLPIQERAGVIRWIARIDGTDHWADTREELVERFPKTKPKSFTFIPAKLEDNRALIEADPDYESNLDAQFSVERERLKNGNWNVRVHAGDYFKRRWFCIVEPDDEIVSEVTRWTRAWDLAATEVSEKNKNPDWTAGGLVGITRDGALVVRDVERFRVGPGGVEDAIVRLGTQDGRGVAVSVWQDPGQAGKQQVEHQRKLLMRHGLVLDAEPATSNKETYAKLWSPVAERGDVYLVRGAWNDAFMSEHEAFPTAGVHDDQVDMMSRAYVFLTRGGVRIRGIRIKGL